MGGPPLPAARPKLEAQDAAGVDAGGPAGQAEKKKKKKKKEEKTPGDDQRLFWAAYPAWLVVVIQINTAIHSHQAIAVHPQAKSSGIHSLVDARVCVFFFSCFFFL